MDPDTRRQLLARMGVDEVESLLEVSFLGGDRVYRDQVITRLAAEQDQRTGTPATPVPWRQVGREWPPHNTHVEVHFGDPASPSRAWRDSLDRWFTGEIHDRPPPPDYVARERVRPLSWRPFPGTHTEQGPVDTERPTGPQRAAAEQDQPEGAQS